jgi:hypothetical protein
VLQYVVFTYLKAALLCKVGRRLLYSVPVPYVYGDSQMVSPYLNSNELELSVDGVPGEGLLPRVLGGAHQTRIQAGVKASAKY